MEAGHSHWSVDTDSQAGMCIFTSPTPALTPAHSAQGLFSSEWMNDTTFSCICSNKTMEKICGSQSAKAGRGALGGGSKCERPGRGGWEGLGTTGITYPPTVWPPPTTTVTPQRQISSRIRVCASYWSCFSGRTRLSATEDDLPALLQHYKYYPWALQNIGSPEEVNWH